MFHMRRGALPQLLQGRGLRPPGAIDTGKNAPRVCRSRRGVQGFAIRSKRADFLQIHLLVSQIGALELKMDPLYPDLFEIVVDRHFNLLIRL
jgi:hypothetical protein